MEEKFKINKKEFYKIVNEFYALGPNISKETFKQYQDKLFDMMGTEVLKEAIDENVLRSSLKRVLLYKSPLHEEYINDITLDMLEGISNYEIVGDWQRFYTVKCDYLFKLPIESKKKFAENFSIKNKDLEKCLLALWENKIETVGVDVSRINVVNSKYSVVIKCSTSDLKFMLETLR